MKINYVLGFIFNEDKTKVLLIEKNKPEFLKGFLNGVGGKMLRDELPRNAMVRECKEEVGINIPYDDWVMNMVLHGNSYLIYVYSAVGDIYSARKLESEEPHICFVDNPGNIVPNLKWILPMILDESVNPHQMIDVV